MGDVMRPLPFRKLLTWILEEKEKYGSIFGIPQEKFFKKENGPRLQLFGEDLETPIGPAAGPHTQLAQNIVAAYLCGGRFFELKTVQVLDQLDIAKPCIDAEDECYNVEWSTELTVEEAFAEYVKAWFLLHVLQKELWNEDRRGFIFNMSVGYDLQGIKSPKVDEFIEGLKDAAQTAVFQECRQVLKEECRKFTRVDEDFIDGISPHICRSVTLSTLHGCPPAEIETICSYLLKEKKLNTFVKLNPTLLGYNFVKETLAAMGYNYISLKEESFSHDLQYEDGLALLKGLKEFARKQGRSFGVKLSNTLPVKNTRGQLPGEEMYLSGRALYPLTINLAAKLAAAFAGELKISFAGGVDAFNVRDVFAAGIWPITVATTLLKPGGYTRLVQLAGELEPGLKGVKDEKIDVDLLDALAVGAAQMSDYLKEKRGINRRKLNKKLPLTDCFIAPCTVGCPIGQDVPEYIRLVGEGRYYEAYELITAKNPLPFITGTICPQFCAAKCTRLDYDEPVCIRSVKKVAAEGGHLKYRQRQGPTSGTASARVAVIGAGPAGLAAGYFLARAGMKVTIFDRREKPGGTVQYVIPSFRIDDEAIARDVELVRETGVELRLGIDPEFSVEALKKEGYKYILLAIGAGRSQPLKLAEGEEKVISAIDFLTRFKAGGNKMNLGRKVVVIGGGDVAMDAARAAIRVDGVEQVSIVYRRTKEYMPANKEELQAALAEGALLKELLLPVSWTGGVLRCQKMELSGPEPSGRRSVVPREGEFEEIEANAVISAVGQVVDYDILQRNDIRVDNHGRVVVDPATNETNIENVFIGGDALRGPATIVEAIADAVKATRAILAREGLTLPERPEYPEAPDKARSRITLKKGVLQNAASDAAKEHERCLECGILCNICAEVCPNRANIAVRVDGSFKHGEQIVHVDGMCNECGNCATFCPYDGAPYKDKLTLFWREDDFNASDNSGFLLVSGGERPVFKVRLEGRIFEVAIDDPTSSGDKGYEEILSIIKSVYQNYKYMF